MEKQNTFTPDDALRSIVVASPIDKDRWKPAIEHGASDEEIRSTLTFAVGHTGVRVSSKAGVCQLGTKPKLRFWLGSFGSGKPTLEGQALVDRIREVLSIPPASEEAQSNGSPEGMQVLSETLGEERVESFLPEDTPELVQIEKASSEESPLPTDYKAYGIKAHIIPLAIAALEKLENSSLDWLCYKLGSDAVVTARLATWMERMGWIKLDYSKSVTNPNFEVQGTFHTESLTFTIDESEQVEDSVAVGTTPAEPEQLSFSFDYSELAEDVADVVRTCTREIQERLGLIKKHTFEIAERLWTVKQNLENGQWSRWVQAETGLSVDTADRLVQVAQILERYPQIAESAESFDKSALYLLAAPSTPEAARQEAAGRAEAGEKITHERAKEIVQTHKPATVTRERTIRTETTRTVKEKQTEAPEEFPAGECRVCGCSEQKPCVRAEDGLTCSWHQKVKDGQTIVDKTICHPCANNLPGWVHPTRSGSARPAASSAPPSTSSSKDWIERELSEDPWNKATIDISFHMFPWDNNVEGRLVQVTVKANELAPKLLFKRWNELYGHPDKGLCLPPAAGELLDWLEAQLAKAPTPKAETPPPKPLIKPAPKSAAPKKKGTKTTAPKKSPAKSPSADRRRAKKPTFSKTKSKSKGAKKK